MEINYFGKNYVFLKGKNESILVDPGDDFLLKGNKARVILYTSEDKGRADLQDDKIFVNGAGEYEIGGVEILGLNGGNGNTFYRVSIDGFKIAVIGSLEEELTEKKIDRFEECDVLIVLLDEFNFGYKLFKLWAKKWGFNYLIPISENKEILNKFLDEFDEEGLEPVVALKLDKQEDLPDGLEIKLLCKSQ